MYIDDKWRGKIMVIDWDLALNGGKGSTLTRPFDLLHDNPHPPPIEAIAALIHQSWYQYQVEHGVVWGDERIPTTHPHLIPWAMMDTGERQSTYWSAEYVYDMLSNDFQVSEGFWVTSFACWHHEGWRMGMVREGWQLGEVRNNEAKIHPYLIEWCEVAESNRGMSMYIGKVLAHAMPYIKSLMGDK